MAEYDSVIPAGKSGKLVAKVRTRTSQHGKITKIVTVSTDATGSESMRLSMVMDVKASILLKPKHSLYINTVVGATQSNRVLLTRTDGKALKITVPEESTGHFTIKAIPVTRPEKIDHNNQANLGDVWVEATVTEPKGVTTRTHQVTLKTNHPEVPEMTIPVTVRVRSMLEARPAQVRLWLSGGNRTGQHTILRLTHNGGEAFEVTKATSSRPELFDAELVTQGSGRSHQIKVGIADDASFEDVEFPIRGFVIIDTTSPLTPQVTVPVMIAEKGFRGSPERLRPTPPAGLHGNRRPAPPRPTGTPGAG